MKKVLLICSLVILLIAFFIGWKFLGPATGFKSDVKFLYIPSQGVNQNRLLEILEKDSIVKSPAAFNWLAGRLDYWKEIKPGKYKISSGDNLVHIVRLLKSGRQTPVNLVITKLRTKEDFASLVGRKFECDSSQFINYLGSEDSLKKYQVDSNTVMTLVFPDTYTYFWNTTPSRIFIKLVKRYD